MVFYFTPSGQHLRDAYNACAALVKDEDWLCFLDRDTMFLTHDYFHIINENIEKHPDVGMFTCLTNRVGNLAQCHNENISEVRDPVHHYKIATNRAKTLRHKLKYTGNPISGLLMIIQKKTWKKVSGLRDGMLGVDTDISREIVKMGKQIAIMQGLYLYHYYRLHTHVLDRSHLKVNTDGGIQENLNPDI